MYSLLFTDLVQSMDHCDKEASKSDLDQLVHIWEFYMASITKLLYETILDNPKIMKQILMEFANNNAKGTEQVFEIVKRLLEQKVKDVETVFAKDPDGVYRWGVTGKVTKENKA